MEDEPDTSPPAPAPPTREENAEAEDTTPQDAPADPIQGPDDDEDEVASDGEDPSSSPGDAPPTESNDLPRTTTTGDDAQDLRHAGDGAVTGAPGDDLDDSAQRHD